MTMLLKTENLMKLYPIRKNVFQNIGFNYSVNDASLEIEHGLSMGLIGESGCGKSTFGRLLCGLEKSDGGKIIFLDQDISNYNLKEFQPMRKNIQMIFQNSGSTFDPKYTIGESIDEVLSHFKKISPAQRLKQIYKTLEEVGLNQYYFDRYPSELSGGERQRANIARAIILKPQFIICDEAVSGLDFAIRKSVLTLLNKISKENGITYLFITHDLSTLKYVCKKLAVMYLGKFVEIMDVEDMENQMCHPYTKALFDSILIPDINKRGINKRDNIGEISIDTNKIKGCRFNNRCKHCLGAICREKEPEMKEVRSGHQVACHIF
jgi:oligopeptide/dipeptide ABC transporter, ATP-binding protein, C-terminal domain